ncbi:hypothetical protein IEQ34_014840 [Dendrobium chrysotoxum]|uniref:Uncharacterized protein n=1 Tax=Dendrobium chrysotoxum TaxID=161865 RepID=A0AAV7GN33_DENCH|nr:hypothetical protein IEQ34_014840 [Dendrobium chrysotoxum]
MIHISRPPATTTSSHHLPVVVAATAKHRSPSLSGVSPVAQLFFFYVHIASHVSASMATWSGFE